MKNLFKVYLKNVGEINWTILGNILSFFGLIILSSRLTFYLSPADYGKLSLLLTIQGLITQMSFGAINNGVARFYRIAIEKRDLNFFLIDCLLLFSKISLVIVLLSSPIFIYLEVKNSFWKNLFFLIVLFSIITGFNSIISTIQSSARQRSIVAFHSILDPWLKIAFVFITFLLFALDLEKLMIIYILVSVIILLSQIFFFLKCFKSNINELRDMQLLRMTSWLKKIISFSLPIMVGGFFNWGFISSQRWALNMFSSIENVGLFSVLSQFTYVPIVLVGGTFLSLITPIIYDKAGSMENLFKVKKTELLIYKISLFIFFSTVFFSLISVFFGENILKYFVSEKYYSVSKYIPYMIFSAGLLQASSVISLVISLNNKTFAFLYVSIVVNSIVIICNFLFTWLYGLSGLIFSLIFGSVLHLVVMYVLSKSNRFETSPKLGTG